MRRSGVVVLDGGGTNIDGDGIRCPYHNWRFGADGNPAGEAFEFGKAKLLRGGEGASAVIVALGALMVGEALKAADALAAEGVEAAVIDALSLKPLDEALVSVVLDLSGRPYLVYELDPGRERVGDFDTSLIHDFLLAFVNELKLNLHVDCIRGRNPHHMIEAAFKGLGRALIDLARAELAKAGCTKFFLMSDCNSDWQFYEHLNMKRILEDHSQDTGDGFIVYMYGGTL